MLLSITTTHRPATDLGFLLHKHPDRVQRFSLPFGAAHVLYPEASEERCTAALLMDVDPVGLVRRGRSRFALAEYVNDRPYVASSLFSVAMVSVFKSAMSGQCASHPELAATAIPLEATLPVVPARGGAELVERLFAPLGYTVETTPVVLDETHPEWGESRYVALTLRGEVRLADLLTHLYVLLPVLDDDKHYWVDKAELEKLLRRGGEWLPTHPEKTLITRRYLKHDHGLTRAALSLLAPGDSDAEADEERPVAEERVSLRDQRLGAVRAALEASGARRVLDLGCGAGALTKLLLQDGYDEILAVDVSPVALDIAHRRLRLDRMPEVQRARIALRQSPLTYRDPRLAGYDAAALVEVIEHLDPPRLAALEQNVFASAAPGTVVVTTPNAEYNGQWPSLPAGDFRHPDHRFEWTRAEFAAWAERVGGEHGYAVRYVGVGDAVEPVGSPTQMAVFSQ